MAVESPAALDCLISIRASARLAEWAKDQVNESVVAARQQGIGWQHIGDALGIKRQTAMERFGKLVERV